MPGYSAEHERQVKITCHAAQGVAVATRDALCAALTASLTKADPPWDVTDQNGAAVSIELMVLSATKRGLTARLNWQSQTATGTSPDMTFDVVDRGVSPELFPSFTRQLLHQAQWPGTS